MEVPRKQKDDRINRAKIRMAPSFKPTEQTELLGSNLLASGPPLYNLIPINSNYIINFSRSMAQLKLPAL